MLWFLGVVLNSLGGILSFLPPDGGTYCAHLLIVKATIINISNRVIGVFINFSPNMFLCLLRSLYNIVVWRGLKFLKYINQT